MLVGKCARVYHKKRVCGDYSEEIPGINEVLLLFDNQQVQIYGDESTAEKEESRNKNP